MILVISRLCHHQMNPISASVIYAVGTGVGSYVLPSLLVPIGSCTENVQSSPVLSCPLFPSLSLSRSRSPSLPTTYTKVRN